MSNVSLPMEEPSAIGKLLVKVTMVVVCHQWEMLFAGVVHPKMDGTQCTLKMMVLYA